MIDHYLLKKLSKLLFMIAWANKGNRYLITYSMHIRYPLLLIIFVKSDDAQQEGTGLKGPQDSLLPRCSDQEPGLHQGAL